eukprot:3269950-Pleurochrysis_carterae.AAC.2
MYWSARLQSGRSPGLVCCARHRAMLATGVFGRPATHLVDVHRRALRPVHIRDARRVRGLLLPLSVTRHPRGWARLHLNRLRERVRAQACIQSSA